MQSLHSKYWVVQSHSLTLVRLYWLIVGLYLKYHFVGSWKMVYIQPSAKLLTALTCHDTKFAWISSNLTAFNTPKSPILHYPYPSRWYVVYTDASDDACRAQLSQGHDGQELLVAFLSHMFKDTQQKWSTMEHDVYDIYCVVTKWNYYLQGSDIVAHNDHKPLQKFLNCKNTATK